MVLVFLITSDEIIVYENSIFVFLCRSSRRVVGEGRRGNRQGELPAPKGSLEEHFEAQDRRADGTGDRVCRGPRDAIGP